MTFLDQQQSLIVDLTAAGYTDIARDVAVERVPDLFAFYADELAPEQPALADDLHRYAHCVITAREAGEFARCHTGAA